MNIGKAIASLRAAREMPQQTLADRLFVSRDLVSKWETGTRCPDYKTIGKIAEIFDVPADAVMDEKDLVLDELSDCFPDGDAISEEDLAITLNTFLHGISAKKADVFLQRYYYHQSVAEISAAYGIGENHVRSLLSKTRKQLKKFCSEGHVWKK